MIESRMLVPEFLCLVAPDSSRQTLPVNRPPSRFTGSGVEQPTPATLDSGTCSSDSFSSWAGQRELTLKLPHLGGTSRKSYITIASCFTRLRRLACCHIGSTDLTLAFLVPFTPLKPQTVILFVAPSMPTSV